MPLQCSICISTFKDPVCLPCGHLYCKKCLSDHVNVPTNTGMTSTCPDCRTVFNIAIPDLNYLPQKYHPFISHAVRRVYIDVASQVSLQKKLKQAERQLEIKSQGQQDLIRRCEGLAAALNAHRMGEAEARAGETEANERIEELEEKLDETQAQHDALIFKIESQLARMKLENQKLELKNERLAMQAEDLSYRLHQLNELDDEDTRNSTVTPSHQGASRMRPRTIKPLPRRSIHRRMREECDSSPPSFYSKRARTIV